VGWEEEEKVFLFQKSQRKKGNKIHNRVTSPGGKKKREDQAV